MDPTNTYNFLTSAVKTDTCQGVQYGTAELGNAAKTLVGAAGIISRWYPGAAAVAFWAGVVNYGVGAVHWALQSAYPSYCGGPHPW